ncbi:MAG: hypothetical protein EXR90_08060 [Methyloglobulus sp.]|nr:hypothetical protein [Methyloglobulus sp.]
MAAQFFPAKMARSLSDERLSVHHAIDLRQRNSIVVGLHATNKSHYDYSWIVRAPQPTGGVYGLCRFAIMSAGALSIAKLIMSGFLVGSGVVAMHYTGMLAMNVQADILWDKTIIAASVGIAVAASIVALWLAVHVKHMWQMVVSALVMGVAVCGMHYTGMVAVDFVHNDALPYISPVTATSSVLALVIAVIDAIPVVIATMAFMGMLTSVKPKPTNYEKKRIKKHSSFTFLPLSQWERGRKQVIS